MPPIVLTKGELFYVIDSVDKTKLPCYNYISMDSYKGEDSFKVVLMTLPVWRLPLVPENCETQVRGACVYSFVKESKHNTH